MKLQVSVEHAHLQKNKQRRNNLSDSSGRKRGLKRRSIHDKAKPSSSRSGEEYVLERGRIPNRIASSEGDGVTRQYSPPQRNHGIARYGPADDSWQEWLCKNANVLVKAVITIAIAIIFGLLMRFLFDSEIKFSGPAVSKDYASKNWNQFELDLRSISKSFPSQNRNVWTQLKAATKSVLNATEPSQPAVILLASSDRETSECMAKKLSEASGKAFYHKGYESLEGVTYSTDKNSKKQLDSAILLALEKHPVLMVTQVQKLSYQAPLVLHSYCDNDNAPFKDSIIFLTSHLEADIEQFGDNSKEKLNELMQICDSTVQNSLKRSWSSPLNNLNSDKIGALLSRIANNVICLKKETILPC